MRKRAVVCDDCLIPRAFCVCGVMDPITVSSRVTVVVHYSDVTRKSNTGRLIPSVLTNSEVLIRGTRHEPLDIMRAVQPRYNNLVLYPSADSIPLTTDFLKNNTLPVNLIVPDGNWNQAGKMEKREKKIAHLQRVHLEISKPSRYRLRTAAHENWISTFEAIARSLGIIENPEIQQRMEYFFEVFVERMLYLKGRLALEDVTGGITRQMLEQFHTDNNDHSFIESIRNRSRK